MKTTRISVALTIVHLIRSEKNPPLARYEILLALATSCDEEGKPLPLTAKEITSLTDASFQSNGNIQNVVARGLAQVVHQGKVTAYTLTDAGTMEVRRILSGTKQSRTPAQLDMQKVKAAAHARPEK